MIRTFGEAALLVELGTTARVHALAAALEKDPVPGVVECVPGIDTLLVELDALAVDVDAVVIELERRASKIPERPAAAAGRHRSIPVVYGGAFGPDLDEVAALSGLTPDAVVAAHAASAMTVAICGFAPGFAYFDGLPAQLDVPRLATPRTSTPAGSVAIAGRRSGIYPSDLPGGWRVIGRTPITLFDPGRRPPAYFAPADRVSFEPIGSGDFERRAGLPHDW